VFAGTSGGVAAVIGEVQRQAATVAAMVAGDVSGDGVTRRPRRAAVWFEN